MFVRAFLMLYRTRLIFAASLSVLVAVGLLMITSAESFTDFGVLWHHFCGCAPEPWDAGILLDVSTFTCLCLGAEMGLGLGAIGGAQASRGGAMPGMVNGEMRFLLTRPMRRSTVLLLPIAIALAVIVLFPAAGLLLLLGWLRLVHAPALEHMVDIARLVHGAEGIGEHPSLLSVLAATHYAWRYTASVSVGLCAFAVYYMQRWWVHSANKWMRWASMLPMFAPILITIPNVIVHARRWMVWLFLLSPLETQPSLGAIGLHLLFAVAMLWSCWRIAQRVEV